MPSRYNINNDESMHRLLSELNVDLGSLPIRYNLAPTDQVPVIHQWEGQRLISDMRWWLVPHWSSGSSTHYPLFNARCENLENSRAFQGCFRHKRCVIPAHSFVEWQRNGDDKTPFLFKAVDQAMAFAGLWDYWSDGVEHILSCAIITTQSALNFEPFSSRMPVLLSPEDAELWLDEEQDTTMFYPLFESLLPYPIQAVAIDSQYGYSHLKNEPVVVGDSFIL
jgi:putative SOS response-associated peptidase YedK